MLRLDSIEIEDLFGRIGFNHQINLNHNPDLSIIVGENGFGKTTILKMIYGILSFDLSIFFNTPFSKVRFFFKDTERKLTFLEITKINGKSNEYVHQIRFDEKSKNGYNIDVLDINRNPDWVERVIRFGIADIENIETRGPYRSLRNSLIHGEMSKNLYRSLYQYLEYRDGWFQGEFKSRRNKEETLAVLSLLDYIEKNSSVIFINTNRLVFKDTDHDPRSYREIRNSPDGLMVEKYNAELKTRLESTLATATQISQRLDSTFPKRIIDGIKGHKEKIDIHSLKRRLDKLNNRRNKLISYGLLDKFTLNNSLDIYNIDDKDREYVQVVLNEYIKDSEEKIKNLEIEAEKIELLQSIINKRFTFKQMEISKRSMRFVAKGDVFENAAEIPLSCLSSGEQHELILFYRLLYEVKENSLVLIDEPELSLHASWQLYFVQDVIDVAKRNHFNVVIATHSPLIVQDHLYLATKLSGGDDEK